MSILVSDFATELLTLPRGFKSPIKTVTMTGSQMETIKTASQKIIAKRYSHWSNQRAQNNQDAMKTQMQSGIAAEMAVSTALNQIGICSEADVQDYIILDYKEDLSATIPSISSNQLALAVKSSYMKRGTINDTCLLFNSNPQTECRLDLQHSWIYQQKNRFKSGGQDHGKYHYYALCDTQIENNSIKVNINTFLRSDIFYTFLASMLLNRLGGNKRAFYEMFIPELASSTDPNCNDVMMKYNVYDWWQTNWGQK